MSEQPLLRVVRGEPSAEDLAVLTALMSVAGGGPGDAEPPERGRWADPAHGHRRPLLSGPGGWRAAGR